MKKQDLLLKMIGLSGELPAGMAAIMIGSDSYTAAVITNLKQNGYISVRNKGGYKGYVLRAKSKEYLLQCYEEDMSFFLQGTIETNHVKSELEKRIRLHRMSMAWVFIWKMGIPIFQSEKQTWFAKLRKGRDGEHTVAYYGSLEFKSGVDAIKGSRACGMLVTGESVYIVYHSMEQKMKWAIKMERTMKNWIERQSMRSGIMRRADAIVIGNSMEFLVELLESDGGIRKNLFQVDDIYESYYYFPMSDYSFVQMQLILDSTKRKTFYQFLCKMLASVEAKPYSTQAGLDKDGKPVYFAYELEMWHLIRVKQELDWKQQGSILCFEYQRKALEKYYGKGVEYIEILSERVIQFLRQ